jgi:hypothetical protein
MLAYSNLSVLSFHELLAAQQVQRPKTSEPAPGEPDGCRRTDRLAGGAQDSRGVLLLGGLQGGGAGGVHTLPGIMVAASRAS